MRGRAVWSARLAHNQEVGGSNPPPATNKVLIMEFIENPFIKAFDFIQNLFVYPYKKIVEYLYPKFGGHVATIIIIISLLIPIGILIYFPIMLWSDADNNFVDLFFFMIAALAMYGFIYVTAIGLFSILFLAYNLYVSIYNHIYNKQLALQQETIDILNNEDY